MSVGRSQEQTFCLVIELEATYRIPGDAVREADRFAWRIARLRQMAEGNLIGRTRPRVVIVGGAPATGKTTLAAPLAQSLRVPLLAKDLIKESLLDSFSATDLAASQRVGGAGWELLFLVAGWLLDARVGFVIEGNFEARATDRLRQIAKRSQVV